MKEVLLVLVLLIFFGLGVTHIFKSDWFVKRSGVRRLAEYQTAVGTSGIGVDQFPGSTAGSLIAGESRWRGSQSSRGLARPRDRCEH